MTALTIRALAEQAGTKVAMIRLYESLGLLDASRRDATRPESYEAHDAERLAFIRHTRDLGFDFGEIRDMLALVDLPESAGGDDTASRLLLATQRKITKLRTLETELQRVAQADGPNA